MSTNTIEWNIQSDVVCDLSEIPGHRNWLQIESVCIPWEHVMVCKLNFLFQGGMNVKRPQNQPRRDFSEGERRKRQNLYKFFCYT